MSYKMYRVYEFLLDGVWYECNEKAYYEILPLRKDYYQLINKYSIYSNTSVSYAERWFLGNIYHRLDGPALFEQIGLTTNRIWIIAGIQLPPFDIENKNITEYLFSYVKLNQIFINQIITLAEHNKWLTEDQIFLLKSMEFFR